ncbi:MAG: phosphoglycerate dehydrogenase [Christensenellales bacterium]|jgi:D-3-phosphoglycerate dehydrogenase
MFSVRTINTISPVIRESLTETSYTIADDILNPDAIIVRSANLLEMPFPENLLAVGRAGAGYNNIPIKECSKRGVVVFNTPGANANAVMELAIAGLLLASRDIIGGIQWAQGLQGQNDVAALVEKGKSQFIGPEIAGKTLGVMGLGAVGGLVANAASALRMKVVGFDPYLSVDAAWRLSRRIIHATSQNEMLEQSDYVSIHAPMTPDTKGMVNREFLFHCKDGVVLMNLARGELVDNTAIKEALVSGKVRRYVTDFPCDELLGVPGILTIPHLGASTPESEENCAAMVAEQIRDYLERGDITHSVNLPDCVLPRSTAHRITAIHQNIPNMIGQLTTVLAAAGLNIENMINKSRGDMGYSVFDLADAAGASVLSALRNIKGVIRIRSVF